MTTGKLVSALAVVAVLGSGIVASAQSTAPAGPPPDQGAGPAAGPGDMPPPMAGRGPDVWRRIGREIGLGFSEALGDGADGRGGPGGWRHDRHDHGGRDDHGGHGMRGDGNGMGWMGGPGASDFLWSMLDPQGKDSITKADVDAAAKARFDAADTNHDGLLSADELAGYMKQVEDQRAEARRKAIAEQIVARRGQAGAGGVTADDLKVGQIGDRMFDRADTNHDGTVTKDEFDAAMKAMHGRWMDGNRGPDDGN